MSTIAPIGTAQLTAAWLPVRLGLGAKNETAAMQPIDQRSVLDVKRVADVADAKSLRVAGSYLGELSRRQVHVRIVALVAQ
jgi:hypothetical protein